MERLIRTSLGVLAVGLVALSMGSAAAARTAPRARTPLVVASNLFAKRYCELLLVRKQGAGIAADVFNTYGLNDCPAAQWAAINTTAVAKATGALIAVRNGPRYWAIDRVEKYRQGRAVIKNLGGLRMIQEAVLALSSLSTTPYTVHKVNRTTVFIWNKGRRIYELRGPDGSVWVMQAWSQQIDPKLGLKDLPGLGKRLHLPAGWSYRSVRLTKSLRVVTVKTAAEVMQDDFDNTYSHVASARVIRTASGASADYDRGLTLGAQAYIYGVPLLDSQRVYRTQTSVATCNPDTGQGPVNQFCSFRRLATPDEKAAPAPNQDTLYTSVWLTNLSNRPEVIHAPSTGARFWEFELIDPWTNNFFNITSIRDRLGAGDFGVTHGGNWAIVGPRYHGRIPAGVKVVHAPYDEVWIAGRTFVAGPSDLAAVHRIQTGYTVTPLSRFGHRDRPPVSHRHLTPIVATIPGTAPGENPLAFYSALDQAMARFRPPPADAVMLRTLAPIGVGPGLSVTGAHLSADTLRGMRDAVTEGHAKLVSAFLGLYLQDFVRHNGYVIQDLGAWGTNYRLRAISDGVAIGGQRANIALYPVALFDNRKAPLTGAKRYVLHIPANRLPIPVKAFWSLTLYDANSYLVPNPLHRYVINRFSTLHRNADGSIDLYVQHARPANPAQADNWLPAPASGSIRLIWRLYGLDGALAGVLDGSGWQPPAIQPCAASGHGNLGTGCAS